MSSKTVHLLSFLVGLAFLCLSLYLALFARAATFYTPFVIGFWLITDFADYKLNNTSVLSFFYNHKRRLSFLFFFFVAFVFAFTVDYTWGVRILKLWTWVDYSAVSYVRMYLIMNACFLLGMYELYRVIGTLIRNKVPQKHLFNFTIHHNRKHMFYISMLFAGMFFLISPLYIFLFDFHFLGGYVMILPFISIILISDSVTFLTGGQPVTEELARLNLQKIVALLLTVFTAFVVTEALNLYGGEWIYNKFPFDEYKILSVPVTVLIGWIPLVVGAISMINMVKHIDYVSRD